MLIARLVLFAILALTTVTAAQTKPPSATPTDSAPPFLPSYFEPAIALSDDNLKLREHISANNIDRYAYENSNKNIIFNIENIKCNNATCPVFLDNSKNYVNQQLIKTNAIFNTITENEFMIRWNYNKDSNFIYAFRTPQNIFIFHYITQSLNESKIKNRLELLNNAINRLRYDQAKQLGIVEQGRWAREFHTLAKQLIAMGKSEEGLSVLKTAVAGAPDNYVAQLDLAKATPDPVLRQNSARVVFDNAENPDLTAQAGALLGLPEPTVQKVAILPPHGTGLQVILIPLSPCDMRLIQDAAATFEKITNIPTRIFRLPEQWDWGTPDRVPNQRKLQQTLAQLSGPATDFTGWSLDRYFEELRRSVEDKDPLTKYFILELISNVKKRPGQYLINQRVDIFINLLKKYRSSDNRTAYIGITGVDIFSGDFNYVFSMGTEGSGASIVSYAMMTARISGEPIEQRRRLVERLAKELVPASLKQFRALP